MWVLPVKVTTDKFIRFFHLNYRGDITELTFSDNYFDLPAKTSRTIYISSKNRIDTKKLSIGHWLTDWK